MVKTPMWKFNNGQFHSANHLTIKGARLICKECGGLVSEHSPIPDFILTVNVEVCSIRSAERIARLNDTLAADVSKIDFF